MGRHRKKPNIKTLLGSLFIGGVLAFGTVGIYNATAPKDHGSSLITQPTKVEQPFEFATVRRVIDGDTFVSDEGDGTSIRILGIDSCEATGDEKSGGLRATMEARELLPVGSKVKLIREQGVNLDRYDRALRYIQLPDGRDYGTVMVSEDHTAVYAGENDASPEYMEELKKADTDGRTCD